LAERKGTLAYYNKYVANSENSDLSLTTPNSSKNSAGSGGQQNQNDALLSIDGNLKSPRNFNVKYNPKAVKSTQNKASKDEKNGKANESNSKQPLVEVDGSKKSGGCCSIL
jgi:hypothetical protein